MPPRRFSSRTQLFIRMKTSAYRVCEWPWRAEMEFMSYSAPKLSGNSHFRRYKKQQQ